jgi:hypothetical protein
MPRGRLLRHTRQQRRWVAQALHLLVLAAWMGQTLLVPSAHAANDAEVQERRLSLNATSPAQASSTHEPRTDARGRSLCTGDNDPAWSGHTPHRVSLCLDRIDQFDRTATSAAYGIGLGNASLRRGPPVR